MLFLISTSLNDNLFLWPIALKRASFAANLFAKHSTLLFLLSQILISKLVNTLFLKYELFFFYSRFNSAYIYNVGTYTVYIHFFNICLNFLIDLLIPINIDSPIRKWPILNSFIPLTLDKTLADEKLIP